MSFRIRELSAIKQLQDKYGFKHDRAERILDIARRYQVNNEPVPGGYVTVRQWPDTGRFSIEEHVGKEPGKVAPAPARDYNQSSTPSPRKRRETMPRGRAAAAVAESAETETATDYTVYKDKEPTATMSDFADWIIQEVGLEFTSKPAEAAFRDGVRLGGTLRMEFQRSDFNKTRREERRAARVAGNGAAETAAAEPESSSAGVRAARASRAAKAKSAPAEATPAEPAAPARRRGRPAAKPTATANAPY